MLKTLIKLVFLSILVVILLYLLNQLGPLGYEAKVALKYLWFGFLGILAISIVSITLIALAAIIFGIGWLKGLTSIKDQCSPASNFAGKIRGARIGEFVKKTVESSINSAFDSDSSNMSSRTIEGEYSFNYESLKVKTANGDIKILPTDSQNIKIKAEIYEKSDKDADIFIENGEIKLKTSSGKKAFFGDISLFLPKHILSLYAESVNGDISIKEISFPKDGSFKGVNGDIYLDSVKNENDITVKSVSGDISFKNCYLKNITIQTVSGDIELKESSADEAVLKSVSGDIDYSGSSVKNIHPKTVSGDIKK